MNAEKRMLEENGHTVIQYLRHNDEIDSFGPIQKAGLFFNTTWSMKSSRQLNRLIRVEHPQVVHFHNILPLISPATYYTCSRHGIPVVQTLHNFRLLCPTGLLFRNHGICEDCITHNLTRSIVHGCYRNSRIQTSAVACMTAFHNWLGTWGKKVDAYIALTRFMKEKFISGGLPGDKLFIKPNFPGHPSLYSPGHKGYALFLGRLSEEKGVMTLLKAWEGVKGMRLKIAGDGPLNETLRQYSKKKSLDQVDFLGYVTGKVLQKQMNDAMLVIHCSECYEGLPLSIMEAFSAGKPVLASKLGAGAILVRDKKNGFHYAPGNPKDLADKVKWALSHPEKIEQMGQTARVTYENEYTAVKNYNQLMDIYTHVIR